MKDLRQCKLCGETKIRIQAGNFDEKNKKFVDESGKLWNGLVCPPCNHTRMKNLYQSRKGSTSPQGTTGA